MAKHKQDETQELPPVTVETVLEQPLKTTETVQIVAAGEVEQPIQKPELQDTYVVDVAGNMSIVKTVKGERPKPGTPLGPFGSRVATKEQIDAYKGIDKA